MNWLNSSIQNKLMAIIVAGAIVILIATSASYNASSSGLNSYDELLSADIENERKINYLLITFKTQVQEWKNTLLRGYDDKNREKYWGRFQEREVEIQTVGAELLGNLTNAQAKTLVGQFLSAHKTMGTAYRKGYNDFVAAGYDHKAGDAAVKGIDRAPAKLLADATRLIEENVAENSMVVTNSAQTSINTYNGMLVAVILIFAGATFFVINRAIVQPSRSLIDSISNISEGHLGDNIDIYRDDELGKLADASRQLQGFLKNVASQLQDTTQQLNAASQALTASTEGVSERVSSAHSSTEHIASAMTEMSATAQEVAGHAASAANLATEADAAAHDGVSTMGTAQTSINNLANQINETVEAVKKLEQDANNVGTVLSVIRGIAEQTNLLALNAAIEAARAGEQGRGFAVVADEVRTLAQKTQQSTAEIEEIIENVQNGAQNTVSVMDASSEITSESAQLFNEASEKLNAITASISQINELNMQVSTAAEEQTSVAEDITRTVVEMSDLVEATAKSAEDNRGTADNLNDIARSVEQVSQVFR